MRALARGDRLLNVVRVLFVGGFVVIAVLIPFWSLLVNSAKSLPEANQLGLGLPTTWKLVENYSAVWRQGNIPTAFVNTLVLTVPSVLLTLWLSSMAAWVFARRGGRAFSMAYYYAICAVLLPPIIVTTVYVLREIGLYGSYIGAILFYCGILCPLSIFLMTGFIKGLPRELEDAARVDGAGPLRVYWNVVLPLLQPILLTTSMFLVLIIWNDLLYQFLLIGGKNKDTLSLSLYNFAQIRQYQTAWNLVFANVVIVNIPILALFVVVQRKLIGGLVKGALNQ